MENKIDCSLCKKRKNCKVLCVHAEAYANQDRVEENPNEKPTDIMEDYNKPMPEGLSTCEAILQDFFFDRLTPAKIAQIHHISATYVYRIIKQYKVIISQNIKKSVESRS
jgi:DNA-directed RNA polymerase specialized sigma subunit